MEDGAKNMTDWEHRYRELLPEYDGTEQENIRLALQLGREMADEHAEEIAQAISEREADHIGEHGSPDLFSHGLLAAARIARSTIKKPETIMPPKDARHPGDYDVVCDRSTGKLYRYAKGVALDYQLDSVRRGNPYLEPKDWALPRWQQDKPKTREPARVNIATEPDFRPESRGPVQWEPLKDSGKREEFSKGRIEDEKSQKTREHVLEEALREMPCTCLFPVARDHVVGCPRGRADAALEWKP
jgi:hypothetical protein